MKVAWRSPKIFRHGGVWLQVWGKWYRVFAANDDRLKE